MPAYSKIPENPDSGYFVYAKVVIPGGTGTGNTFLLSETARPMYGDSDYYYLLVGILNSEFDGERSFAQMYGFTEILPGRITTDRIVSADGTALLDLAENALKLGGGSSGLDWNISEENTLTIRGLINALGAILGGFQIDNDKFQSLKQTDGQPNILLNGSIGTGQFAGGNFFWDAAGNCTLNGNLKTPYVVKTTTTQWPSANESYNMLLANSAAAYGMVLSVDTSNDGREADILNYFGGTNCYLNLPGSSSYFLYKGQQLSSVYLKGQFARVRLRAFIPPGAQYCCWIIMNPEEFLSNGVSAT